jgi:hypothetical protein
MADENFTIDTKFTVDHRDAIRDIEALDRQFDELRRQAIESGNGIRSALTNVIPSNLGGGAFAGFGNGVKALGSTVRAEAGSITSSLAATAPASGALTSLGAAAGPVGAAVAVAGAAMIGAAGAAGRYADEIDDTATALNVTTGFLQKHSAAVALAGGSGDAFEKGIGKMNIKIGEAATGNKAAIASFAALGVSVTDAEGKVKGNEQVYDEVREKLAGLESDTVRLAAANDIFGKGAKDMSGVLKMNQTDYEDLIAEVSKYGVANDAAIQAAGRLGDAYDLLGNATKAGVINAFAPLTSALGDIAISVLPAVGNGFKALGSVIDGAGLIWSILGDAVGAVWNLFKDGIGIVAKAVTSFGPFRAALNATGDAGDTLRDRYINVLQQIIRGSTTMAAAVAGRFTELAAQVRNIGASIANFAVDAGLAGIFGIKGKIEIVDPVAEGNRVRQAILSAGDAAVKYVESKRKQITPDREAESGGTTAGYTDAASDSKGKASKASKDAADAEKKYADEVKKLEAEIKNLTLTTEQKTLADRMEAAGLSRDINQIGEKADKIRELHKALQEGEEKKKVGEVIGELAVEAAKAGMSVEQLAKVEARRRAGLPLDLAINNELTKSLDDQAVATMRAANAKAEAEKVAAMKREIEDDQFGIQNRKDGKTNPIDAAMRAETRAIEQRLEARRKDIELMQVEQSVKDELIEQAERLAEAEKAEVAQDAAEQKADILSDRIIGIFTDAEQAKEQFFTSMIAYLVEAGLKALLLGENLAGATGGGGGIGGMIMNAIGAGFGLSFGGGRASGGSVRSDEFYLVGENGPEILAGASGTVIPNHKLGVGNTTMNSGGVVINPGQNTFIINGGNANAQELAGHMSREQERVYRRLIRDELGRKGR